LTKTCPKSSIKKAAANWQKMPRINPEKRPTSVVGIGGIKDPVKT
jgi:hypothetical protein